MDGIFFAFCIYVIPNNDYPHHSEEASKRLNLIEMGSINLSRPAGTQFSYILTVTALRLTACTVLCISHPYRVDL